MQLESFPQLEVPEGAKVFTDLPTRPGHANQLPPSLWLFFPTRAERQDFIAQCLAKRIGNYFMGWLDVQGFGLEVTWAAWVGENRPHFDLSDR